MVEDNLVGSVSQASSQDTQFVVNQQGQEPKKDNAGVIEQEKPVPGCNGRMSEISTFPRMPNGSASLCNVESISCYTLRTDGTLPGTEPLNESLGSAFRNRPISQNGVEIQKYFIRTEKVRDKNPSLHSSYWEVLCQFCEKPMQSNAKTMENHFCGKRSKICPIAPDSVRRDAIRIQKERCEKNEKNRIRNANSSKAESGQKVSNIMNMATSHPRLQELSSEQRSIDESSETLHRKVGDMHRKVSGGSESTSIENCQLQRKGSSTLSQYKMKVRQALVELEAMKKEMRASKEETEKLIRQKILDVFMEIRSGSASTVAASFYHDRSVEFPILGSLNDEVEENTLESDQAALSNFLRSLERE